MGNFVNGIYHDEGKLRKKTIDEWYASEQSYTALSSKWIVDSLLQKVLIAMFCISGLANKSHNAQDCYGGNETHYSYFGIGVEQWKEDNWPNNICHEVDIAERAKREKNCSCLGRLYHMKTLLESRCSVCYCCMFALMKEEWNAWNTQTNTCYQIEIAGSPCICDQST